MTDYISRDGLAEHKFPKIELLGMGEGQAYRQGWNDAIDAIVDNEPSADVVKVVRCKDCRWWDKYGDYDNGYCMAAKHGYWSEHWEISIRRTYKGDFYCADAEPKGEQE